MKAYCLVHSQSIAHQGLLIEKLVYLFQEYLLGFEISDIPNSNE
jgi:hypothetical protein